MDNYQKFQQKIFCLFKKIADGKFVHKNISKLYCLRQGKLFMFFFNPYNKKHICFKNSIKGQANAMPQSCKYKEFSDGDCEVTFHDKNSG